MVVIGGRRMENKKYTKEIKLAQLKIDVSGKEVLKRL